MIENRWIPHRPTEKQASFLVLPHEEALYGGAAGGGKTDALLMAALQFVDYPGYAALLLRRTFPELAMPKGLMDRAHEWLRSTAAKWNGELKSYRFPSGATLNFGYCEYEDHKYRYQGPEFQFVGFDELTQFSKTQYMYLKSRIRRLVTMDFLPIRLRGACNPGGPGHRWVSVRYGIKMTKKGRAYGTARLRPFIPARLEDNPYLDQEAYTRGLSELDPVTRAQLLVGDWSAKEAGKKFQREWFKIVDAVPRGVLGRVRYWDFASTLPKRMPGGGMSDPDWTAGALMAKTYESLLYLEHMNRFRGTPLDNERSVKQQAVLDGHDVQIWIEQEPGASGVTHVDRYIRVLLQGYACYPNKVTGSKELRANPLASQAEAGNIFLVDGPWVEDFLEEAEAFPYGDFDDQVDAASGALEKVAEFQGGDAPDLEEEETEEDQVWGGYSVPPPSY